MQATLQMADEKVVFLIMYCMCLWQKNFKWVIVRFQRQVKTSIHIGLKQINIEVNTKKRLFQNGVRL